jgi:hypothetical protein
MPARGVSVRAASGPLIRRLGLENARPFHGGRRRLNRAS